MSITTYSELQTAVGNWLSRADLTSRIPEFIALAEAEFQRSIRNRQMEQRTTATVTEYTALPTDYLELRDIQLNISTGKKTLELLSPREIDRRYSASTGEPAAYCIIANQLQFGPAPNATYTCELDYYKKIPVLSNSNTTNWLLTDHPDVYLTGAMVKAIGQIQDDTRLPGVIKLYQTAMGDLLQYDRRQRWSGPPMATRAA